MWQTSEYFQIINENDKVIEKALEGYFMIRKAIIHLLGISVSNQRS